MSVTAIILAAGKSTRMKSKRPKPLHEVCGKPMLAFILDACFSAGCDRLLVVVGHGKDKIISQFGQDTRITWVEQTEQLGTGHAARMCEPELRKNPGDVFILAGDGPLIRGEILSTLLARPSPGSRRRQHGHRPARRSFRLRPHHPRRAWKIRRNRRADRLHARAARDPRSVPQPLLRPHRRASSALSKLNTANKKGEYYLTDIYAILRAAGKKVIAVQAVTAEDVLAVNTRQQLAEVDAVMQDRIQHGLRDRGVTIVSSAATYIEAGVTIGQDTIIQPFTFIGRDATIGADCVIGPFAQCPASAIVREADRRGRQRIATNHPAGYHRMRKSTDMPNADLANLKLFTGRANQALAQKICDYLQIPLGRGRTELFPDGELIVRVEEDVRGRDCFIVQPTSHPVNAHLMELFIWIDTLRRASANA